MKIDIFTHILPEKYLAVCKQKAKAVLESPEAKNPAVIDMDVRLRVMDRYPDVLQVLTLSLPPLESTVTPELAVELSRIANDELAGLVLKYPDKFIAGVACLPMNDIDAALEEADRAVTQLGLKGVQIYSTIHGETLDNAKFRPLYEKMARYDLPIWIHPCTSVKNGQGGIFGWPYETSCAMLNLVATGVFRDFPDIKFVVHHCGAMVPFFEGRIKWLFPYLHRNSGILNPVEYFRKFYGDTASYGSTGALMCGYTFFGAEHLLFGTDAPLGPPFGLTLDTIETVERMSIPDADKEKIFRQNAVNLLRLAI